VWRSSMCGGCITRTVVEPPTEWDDDTAAAISHISATGPVPFDKIAALEKAFKHLGLYERDNTQRPAEAMRVIVELVGEAVPAPTRAVQIEHPGKEQTCGCWMLTLSGKDRAGGQGRALCLIPRRGLGGLVRRWILAAGPRWRALQGGGLRPPDAPCGPCRSVGDGGDTRGVPFR
jgi:hypothetical protein